MAQQKPERASLDQVLKLVDQLSPDEQEQLRQNLNTRTWGQRWQDLSERILARFEAAGIPVPAEDEVMSEVKAVRPQRKDRRTESGN